MSLKTSTKKRPTRKTRSKKEPRNSIREYFGELGPGLITGAADDDPSGISTYSVTGASFGYGLLWTPILSLPMMTAVQTMCARLGMVTGRGLAGAIRRRYSAWVLWGSCILLIVANTINIGADLGGMSEAMEMITGVGALVWLPFFAVLILSLLTWTSYRLITQIFKWLTLALFAYAAAAFLARPDWSDVLKATFVPHVELSLRYLATLVGILGTTISPYLFFWQAGQEVEEERKKGRKTRRQRKGATEKEISASRRDVITGMVFSNSIMYFIILTTGATLYPNGQREIETARQAAEALQPVAGDLAYLLFGIGLVGTGMLGVPALAGAAAYAVAEAMHWRGSLDDRPPVGKKFFGVIGAAVVLGLVLNYLELSAVKMLFWAAVVNGVLAPPLIVIVTLLTSDRTVMGERTNPPLLRWLGWITALVMGGSSITMVIWWLA